MISFLFYDFVPASANVMSFSSPEDSWNQSRTQNAANLLFLPPRPTPIPYPSVSSPSMSRTNMNHLIRPCPDTPHLEIQHPALPCPSMPHPCIPYPPCLVPACPASVYPLWAHPVQACATPECPLQSSLFSMAWCFRAGWDYHVQAEFFTTPSCGGQNFRTNWKDDKATVPPRVVCGRARIHRVAGPSRTSSKLRKKLK